MSRRLRQIIGIGYLAMLSLPLLIHAYTGTFVRLIADDYCSAVIARTAGIWGGVAQWYLTWSGRYSANFLDSIIGSIGPDVTRISTPLALALWFLALAAAVWFAIPAGRNMNKYLCAGLSSVLLLFCTLELSPNVSQSIYWQQGMHSLVPPLILASVYIGLLLYRWKASPSRFGSVVLIVVSGIMTFIAGGFSETYVAVQTTLLIVLLCFGLMFDPASFKKRLLWINITGFLGSLLAMILVVSSPGNQIRQAYYPPPPGLWELLRITFESALVFWVNIVISKRHLLTAIVLLAIPMLMGAGFMADAAIPFPNALRKRWAPVFLILAAAIVQLACFAPAAYGMSDSPPDRTLIIPAFFLACTLAFFGFLIGQAAAERVRFRNPKLHLAVSIAFAAMAGGLILVGVSWNSIKTIRVQSALQTYSEGWDRMDRMLRDAASQGKSSEVLQPIQNGIGLEDIGPDSSTWVNQCAGEYYGLTLTTE